MFINTIIIGWSFITAGLYTVIIGVPVIILSFFSRTGKLPYLVGRAWAFLIVKTNRVKIRVEGIHRIYKSNSYVFISNHASNLDPPVIACALKHPLRFVAKKSLAKVPLFGIAIRLAKMILIDRDDATRSRETINKVVKDLKDGVSAFFFAEGSRSPDGKLQRFKKGGIMLALRAKLPIVPITIVGSHKLLPKKTLRVKPGVIKVIIDNPIDTFSYTEKDRDCLLNKVHAVISSNLEKESCV